MDNQITPYQAMKTALQKIANPIAFMQEEAVKEGAQLNGMMAIQIASDPNYLKNIAQTALNLVDIIEFNAKEKADKEAKGWEDFREGAFKSWKEKQPKEEETVDDSFDDSNMVIVNKPRSIGKTSTSDDTMSIIINTMC